MANYTFYIYSANALAYNPNTAAFELSPTYDSTVDRYRVEVSDDDNEMHVGGDNNQVADVYDMNGTLIDSGVINNPAYANVQDSSGSFSYMLDRIEVDGTHYGYISSTPLTPGESYPVQSSNTGGGLDHSYFESSSTACFSPGTLIATARGERPIEEITAGDRVKTMDHGTVPVLWAGCWSSWPRGPASGAQWPVTLHDARPGTQRPTIPLTLSAHHRVLLRAPWFELSHDSHEVLAPACGVAKAARPKGPLIWHHLLFPRHEIIRANGVWVESLFFGGAQFNALPKNAQAAATRALGPLALTVRSARPCVTRKEAELFVAMNSERVADRVA